MTSRNTWKIAWLVSSVVVLALQTVHAQQRLQRDGITLYWGLVPAAVVSQKHSLQEMHGVVPSDGGQVHHLVVALFESDGRRIVDAVVRAQLGDSAQAEPAPKYLTPMAVDGQMTYGQLFSNATAGPYRLRVFVKPAAGAEIVFTTSAWPAHGDR